MTFERNKTFADGQRLFDDDLNLIWDALENAIDGIDGGSYTLANTLDFAGAGNVRFNKYPILTSTSKRIRHPLHLGDRWSSDGSTTYWDYNEFTSVQHLTGAGETCYLQLCHLEHGSTLTNVRFRVEHLGSHGGTLPTTKQRFRLRKADISGSSVSYTDIVAATEDNSASAAAYEAMHTFDLAVPNEVIDLTNNNYFVQLLAETGGTATDGFNVYAMWCDFTSTTLRAPGVITL